MADQAIAPDARQSSQNNALKKGAPKHRDREHEHKSPLNSLQQQKRNILNPNFKHISIK